MGEVRDLARTFLRDFVVAGVPASGVHQPGKAEGITTFDRIDDEISTLKTAQASSAVAYATQAALNADLAHPAGSKGEVYGDPDGAKVGVYSKTGALGSGGWTRIGPLNLSTALRYDNAHNRVGLNGTPLAPWDVYGQSVTGAGARGSDLDAGFADNVFADTKALARWVRTGVGKVDWELRGSGIADAAKRLSLVDTDGAGSELLTVSLNGSRRIGVSMPAPLDSFHVNGALRFSDETLGGAYGRFWFDPTTGVRAIEPIFSTNAVGLNVLVLQNTNNQGFSALVARDETGVEHTAIGYGNTGSGAHFGGKVYWEISHFTGSPHTTPPPQALITQTGYIAGAYANYDRVVIDSNGDIFFQDLNSYKAFRYKGGKFGIRRDPEADLDIFGQVVISDANAAHATDLAGGFSLNVFSGAKKHLRLVAPSIVKADFQVTGTAYGSSDRRLDIVDSDNSGIIPLSLALNGSGQVTLGGALRHRSYTVATLPSAATVGALGETFVSDARRPVAGAVVTGGGSVAVPVYSDGSQWRVRACPYPGLREVLVANDSVVTASLDAVTQGTGLVTIWTLQGTKAAGANGRFRARSFGSAFIENLDVDATVVNFTTGILNGTTGATGKLTISVHTDGRIYIENRLGAEKNISLAIS